MDALKKILRSIFISSEELALKPDLQLQSTSATAFAIATWKVRYFTSLKGDEKLRSPTFNCCDATWAIDLYLEDDSNDCSVICVKLYLRKVFSTTKVQNVKWKLGFRDIYGRNQYSFGHQNEFEGNESGWGQKQGIPVKELLAKRYSEFIREDSIIVFCEIDVRNGTRVHTEGQTPPQDRVTETSSVGNIALSKDFEVLLASGRNSDVDVRVGDQTFPAHKAILVARSSVFAAMFEHDMKESRTNVITVEDIDPPVFKNLLLYMYAGRIEDLSYGDAFELYGAADKYDLSILKEQCAEVMLNHLSLENVCEMAVLSDTYSDDKIMHSIKSFVIKNARSVLRTSQWKEIIEERPRLASVILLGMSSALETTFAALPNP